MSYVARIGSPARAAARPQAPSTSLTRTVGDLCRDVLRVRGELESAQREIERLRRQLAVRGGAEAPLHSAELSSLRRDIAFYCHPDRGGDDGLMRRVNRLFDHIEGAARRSS